MPKRLAGLRSSCHALLVLLPAALGATAARAAECDAPGKVVYEDRLTDGSGGWQNDPSATFGQQGLTLELGASEDVWTYINQGFDAADADYCVAAVLPEAPSKDNSAAIGLALLQADEDNYVSFIVYNDGTIQLARKASGSWGDLLNEPNTAVTPAPGSVVVLRVTVKDGLLTAFVNGVEVKKARVQVPRGSLRFGVVARTDKPADRPLPFRFKQVRVTALP